MLYSSVLKTYTEAKGDYYYYDVRSVHSKDDRRQDAPGKFSVDRPAKRSPWVQHHQY